MEIYRAYKTELKLNNKQKGLMVEYAGLSRFAYNWGLAFRKEQYENHGKKFNSMDLHKELVKLKQEDFAWMYNYSKSTPQQSLRDLDKAFENFFRKVKSGATELGYPKFKSRHTAKKVFKVEGKIKVEKYRIRLPRIGWLRLKERDYLPTEGVKVLSATVSERVGKWFVSVQVRKEQLFENPLGDVVGIDIGIKELAVTSDNKKYYNPKTLYKHEQKLARFQKSLSRKKKGSNNYKKQKLKLAKLHFKIANIRKDTLHKVSFDVVAKTKPHPQRPSVIVLEDLNVKGMMKNHKLAKVLNDASMSELTRQIVYKSEWQGTEIQRVDRFFPSTKLCSNCGNKKKETPLSMRVYKCENCGLEIDRDLNAAINLKNTASSAGIKACGDGSVESL